MLSEMNKVCSDWKPRDRNQFIEQLEAQRQRTVSISEKVNYYFQEVLMDLNAHKSDYKNWVELAVSFDK